MTVRLGRGQTEDALDIRHEIDEGRDGQCKLMRAAVPGLSYSWAAGRRFSVAASEDEAGAA